MKITDYEKVQSLVPNNVVLIDGDNGTHTIMAEYLAKELIKLVGAKDFASALKISELEQTNSFNVDDKILIGTSNGNLGMAAGDIMYSLLDEFVPVYQRRMFFRGKNLGPVFTEEQKAEIKAGTFKGMFIGDYWEIGDHIWRIADFDYWIGTGDVACQTHHIVIIPDGYLYTANMNSTNTTAGGYVGSEMYTNNLENAKALVISAFGDDCILNHQEYLSNGVVDGRPSTGGWFSSTTELPSELMMYGTFVFTPNGNGVYVSSLYTNSKNQLALMSINPFFINPKRQTQWLRDVVSPGSFACLTASGLIGMTNSTSNYGVRPVTGITGGN